ncbi:FlgD immunoglobulin-like domain containing protein [Bacteroidota bacterium]
MVQVLHSIIFSGQKTFGGSNSDGANDIVKTTDGGYALAGFTYSYGAGNNDMYLIKTDADGNEQWSKTFGDDGWEYANALLQSDDGGYLVLGYTTSFGSQEKDIYLVKTDASGNEVWTKRYGGINSETGRDISKTSDGGYIICGDSETNSNGENDLFIVKIDELGNETWSNHFGYSLPEWGNSIIQTSDGGYIAAGCLYSSSTGNMDYYVIKIDVQGFQEWYKSYSGGPYDWANAIVDAGDGGFFIGGHGDTNTDMMSMNIKKIDGNGLVEWTRTLTQGSQHEYCNDIIALPEGGVFVCGTTKDRTTMYNKLYVARLTPTGTISWSRVFNDDKINNGNAVCMADDGSVIVAGQTNNVEGGKFDAWLVKIEATLTDVTEDNNPLPEDFELFQNIPNPFNPSTTIKFRLVEASSVVLEIFDINGELINTLINEDKNAGTHSIKWDATDSKGTKVSSGVYFYKITANNHTITKKMTLLK